MFFKEKKNVLCRVHNHDPLTAARKLQEIQASGREGWELIQPIDYEQKDDLLMFEEQELGDEDMATLINKLREYQNVAFLVFDHTFVENTDLAPLFVELARPRETPLKNLEISQDFTQNDLQALGNFLADTKTLKHLTIVHSGIDGDSIALLLDGIMRNSSISILNLDRNNLGDAGVKALLGALTDNQRLKALTLRHNNITDEGASEILEFLKWNKSITTLWANDNSMSPDKLREIYDLTGEDPKTRGIGRMTKSAKKRAW